MAQLTTDPNQQPQAGYAPVQPGTELNQTYRIDYLIGIGGMAEVFLGQNIQTGDPVAIKIVLPEFARDEFKLELFRKEARVLHHLNHDAIVRYYGFSFDAAIGRPYLAMEYIDGPPLAERLATQPLSLEECNVLRQRVADGLQRAHEAGIIHRDISPDNVILPGGRVDRAKIIDFGIAKSAEVGGGTLLGGAFAGKYNFVSPEQLGLYGANVTAKSDIYSLGLVFAAAIQGRPIDMTGSQAEVLEKRRTMPDLSGVPPDMQALLRSMLEPDPAARLPSMSAVRDWNHAGDGASVGSEATVVRPGRPDAIQIHRPAIQPHIPRSRNLPTAAPRRRGWVFVTAGLVIAATAIGSVAGWYHVNLPRSTGIPPLVAPTIAPLASNSATPQIRGTWPEGAAQTLKVNVGSKSYKLGIAPELSSKAGNWLLKPSKPLAEGMNEVTAEVEDGAGHAVKAASPGQIFVDTIAPAAPATNPVKPGKLPSIITGTWPEGDAVKLSASVAGHSWTLGKDAALSSDGNGNWTLKPDITLEPGAYDLVIEAFDKVGNRSRDANIAEIVIDKLQPPPVPTPVTNEDFIGNYDGGGCFLAITRTVPETGKTVVAYGDRQQAFEQFRASYVAKFSEEPNARFSLLTNAQCKALNLVRQIDRSNTGRPWLKLLAVDLRTSKIVNGSELMGTIAGLRQSSRYLLAIDDEGKILNLTSQLRNSGDSLVFSQHFTAAKQGLGLSQLIVALSASVSLPALENSGEKINASDFEFLSTELSATDTEAAVDMKSFSIE